MNFWWLLGSTAVVLLGYAGFERLLRSPALAGVAARLDHRASTGVRALVAAALVLGSWITPWRSIGLGNGPFGWFAGGVAVILAWNAATRDEDPVAPGPSGGARALLCALALCAFWSPLAAVATAVLLSARFGFWQHHAAFPMRVQLLVVAYLCGRVLASPWPTAVAAADGAFVVVLLTMMVSHYFITALAKMALGPKPWSWPLDNRLHYLAASAYSWGWARFLPWARVRLVVKALRRVEVPLQCGVFLLELSCPLALLDHRLAAGFAFALAGFHLGVCLVSGLCFWDWAATDVLIGALLLTNPAGLGLPALLLSLALLAIFPLRHKLWKPMPLAWYDTPFTQRVHWVVVGSSGREYRLDNGFMCPHERLYGKVHGCFAVERAVLTYHLGESFRPEVRDAIVLAGPNPSALDAVRQRFGIRARSDELTAGHVAYLQAFFARLNAGAKKAVLPGFARRLKAPGDQLFYWGDGPSYETQEPVAFVRLTYREQYFDGEELVTLCDDEVLRFAVPSATDLCHPSARELTPRQLDDYLLGLAAGRLIRISGARARYLTADDAVRAL